MKVGIQCRNFYVRLNPDSRAKWIRFVGIKGDDKAALWKIIAYFSSDNVAYR